MSESIFLITAGTSMLASTLTAPPHLLRILISPKTLTFGEYAFH
jgi:hypothetical protein